MARKTKKRHDHRAYLIARKRDELNDMEQNPQGQAVYTIEYRKMLRHEIAELELGERKARQEK